MKASTYLKILGIALKLQVIVEELEKVEPTEDPLRHYFLADDGIQYLEEIKRIAFIDNADVKFKGE